MICFVLVRAFLGVVQLIDFFAFFFHFLFSIERYLTV
jgi:hypothetical protein